MPNDSLSTSDAVAQVAHAGSGDVPIELSTSGAISNGDREAVTDLFDKLLGTVDEPVRHVRVRMDHAPDRNRDRSTTIRAVVDIRGGSVRAHVTEATTHSALVALDTKLTSQLRQRLERQRSLAERKHTNDGAWRHGMAPVSRPDYFPRPREEREVVRHKSVAPGLSSVEEAIFDLTTMDYDFYLYVDDTTRRDALVFRRDGESDTELHVQCVGGAGDPHPVPDGVVVDGNGVPELTLEGARERLDVGHEPFVFFVDPDAGRGHVLYRRYDGHYGLLVPQDE
ncbi:MAG: sigma 54 modulation/S30EA ribosomal C-terminal domain-containing protein [Actinomycetota bacterium]